MAQDLYIEQITVAPAACPLVGIRVNSQFQGHDASEFRRRGHRIPTEQAQARRISRFSPI